MDWLYRFHAPVIGVLAAVPILYVAVTGGLLTHPQWLERLTQDVQLRREQLLWTYRFESLRDEVTHVVAYPGEPRRLSIATRLGVLHSGDGGRSWRRDPALAPKAHNLFREGDTVFASPLDRVHWYRRDGADDWRAFTGPVTAITDAARTRDGWLVKNSRSLWSGAPDSGFRPISVPYPPADGATAFLFAVDIHTGYVIHRYFKWVNVAAASLVVLLLVTGPVLWWRAKWR
jgi:hypothetical protein